MKRLLWLLWPGAVALLAALAPRHPTGTELNVWFFIILWTVLGPPLLAAAILGRASPEGPPVASNRDFTQAGKGLVVVFAVLGVPWLLADFKSGQVAVGIVAMGLAMISVGRPRHSRQRKRQ